MVEFRILKEGREKGKTREYNPGFQESRLWPCAGFG